MIKDLHDYIRHLSEKGMLLRVDAEVDPELEITAFTERASRTGSDESKTLLFNKVKGYDMPVVTNLFASYSMLSTLFGETQIGEIISSAFSKASGISLIKSAKALMDLKPKTVPFKKGRYEELDGLSRLPVPKVWPNDAGRFLTLPVVSTQSPVDGSANAGIYRMQVFDSFTTGMHWQAQKGGSIHASEAAAAKKRLNVSVAIGADPYSIISAVAPLPQGISEFAFSGIARGSRSILLSKEGYPPVPESSEIILYGYVDPSESRIEGPFGDHTGYYSIPEPANVFNIEEVYARKDPVYASSVVGHPWNEDAAISRFLLEYMKPAILAVNDSITDIYLPPEGVFTNLCFISVKKRFPGEAKRAMFSVLGLGQLSFTKMIAAFDPDIDIRDLRSVAWALSTRVDPERDMQIIGGVPTDTLDHTSNLSAYGSKVMIDATKKTRGEGYSREWPDTISLPASILEAVERKWKKME